MSEIKTNSYQASRPFCILYLQNLSFVNTGLWDTLFNITALAILQGLRDSEQN